MVFIIYKYICKCYIYHYTYNNNNYNDNHRNLLNTRMSNRLQDN